MDKILIVISCLFLLSLDCFAQYNQMTTQTNSQQNEVYDPGIIRKAQTIDYFLGIVPSAVQIRKHRWGWAAGIAAGTIGFTVLAVCQNDRLNKAIVNADADPSNAVYYEGVMHKARLWRNIGLIGLGVTEIINYVSAIRLEDRSNIGQIALYADPTGAMGLTYTFNF